MTLSSTGRRVFGRAASLPTLPRGRLRLLWAGGAVALVFAAGAVGLTLNARTAASVTATSNRQAQQAQAADYAALVETQSKEATARSLARDKAAAQADAAVAAVARGRRDAADRALADRQAAIDIVDGTRWRNRDAS